MSSSVQKSGKLQTVDPIWDAMIAQAEDICAAEPFLTQMAITSVLNHTSFESALAHRLAAKLDHPDVPADLIRKAFDETLVEHSDIAASARADLAATLERDPACHRIIDPFLFFKGFQAIQTHRIAHALWQSGRKDFAYYLQSRSSQVFQTDINPAARIGKGIMLDHATGFVVGETAVIGDHVSILHSVTLGGTGKSDQDRHPKIGDGVLLGAGAKILGNIRVGECSRVAAGSVVLKEVPPRTTVAGVPARVVGEAGCNQPATVMDQIVMVPRD